MIKEAYLLPSLAVPDTHFWIGTREFADLAKIAERNANEAMKRCLSGKTWRTSALEVRLIEGAQGHAGKSYQVNVASLPPELRQAWQERHPELFEQPAIPSVTVPLHLPETADSKMAGHWAEAQWRLDLLYPALRHRPRSPARGAEVRYIANREHRHWTGEMMTISKRRCEQLIAQYEEAELKEKGTGIFALMRKPRSDKGRNHVLVCLGWQTACPLPNEEKQQIAETLGKYIRSLWAQGVPTWRRVDALASAKLLELSVNAGWKAATFDTCKVGRHAVEKERGYQLIAIHDQDAKKYHDHFLPRIQRIRDNLLPMDIVVGDVHPVDILVMRDDGSTATARAIAWLDLATNRIHVTLILLRPREGVKQIHIAQSFCEMVRAWGFPRRLYLDNGSEYSWEAMMEGFRTLAAMVSNFYDFQAKLIDHEEVVNELAIPSKQGSQEPGTIDQENEHSAIIRAQPYNAQAKAIEGIFGVLETSVFPMIQGYIGGNRMAKKTHNIGKEPKPFQGGFEAFHHSFETALDFYHRQPQKNGPAPSQRLLDFVSQGWKAVKVPETALLFAFSTREQLQVRNNGITLTINGEEATYWHDDMIPLIQGKTTVSHAKHAPDCILFTNQSGNWVAAPLGDKFRTLDQEGAKEKARRVKLSKANINEMRANTARLDLVGEMSRFNGQTPNPETPFGMEVLLSPEMQALSDAMEKLGAPPPPIRIEAGEFIHPKTGEHFKPTFPDPKETRLGEAATPPSLDDALLNLYKTRKTAS